MSEIFANIGFRIDLFFEKISRFRFRKIPGYFRKSLKSGEYDLARYKDTGIEYSRWMGEKLLEAGFKPNPATGKIEVTMCCPSTNVVMTRHDEFGNLIYYY